jgi:hypothetical protein
MKIFRMKSGEKGALPIIAVVGLSLLGTLGLLVIKGPTAINNYNSAMREIRNGAPTNDTIKKETDAVAELVDAAGGLPIPTGPEDAILIGATYHMNSMVEMASRPTPDPQQGYGKPGQTIACGIQVNKTLAKPGELVTATVTIPKPFQNKISRISGLAGNEGLSFPKIGGQCSFNMPSDSIDPVAVRFEAFNTHGNVECEGSLTVKVDISASDMWVAGYTKPDGPFMAIPFTVEKDKYVPAANKVILGEGLSKSKAIEEACYKFEFLSEWHMCCCYYYGQHGPYKVCIDYYDWNRCWMIQ